MSTPKPRVKLPKSAAKDEIITIKTLISHDMESGQRKDKDGNAIPRKILNTFTCEFNGQAVFSCNMEPAISANPYFEFNARVPESGTFKFSWVDDDGTVITHEQDIEVK
ncbi:thiosulfate oxidation carrier complex protein SoxZ [Rhodospirillaceae bacterium KN72]|uniref:Thiosulfate oxidation carrier complex protein SoxZ n=1 Tax=Pacificispira spongiicola TaxID=2729598 RepID=A0A7Y0E2X4_9PROT|nr:thiosulfate oxidation carrier complex protein SoxZ [Pacificispira spongiicola]NMM46262.1 thiosulfate oxidation carrier complex protein SoxZ [Pacificispira spongiicola]